MQLNKPILLLAALAVLLSVSACQSLAIKIPGAPSSITGYAAQLTEMDPSQLRSELEDAQSAWEQNNTAANQARLGLVRGMWGYAGFNPERAADELRQALLQSTTYWQTNQRAFLNFQAAQLESIAQRENALGVVYRQKAQVENDLKEAREKLQAISNIERDLGR